MADRVLVTGAAGFIAGYVIQELLRRGYSVTGLDDESKYGPVARSFDGHPEYLYVRGDARDVSLMTRLLEGCDHFIAGAAMIGGIGYFHRYPYDLLAVNERITAAAGDAAIEARKAGRLRKVTWLSSSMVYESATTFPSAEGDQFCDPPPVSSYGFQKLAVEYFARAARDQHGLPFTIVRPFNCVGTGEARSLRDAGADAAATGHVVPDLARKVLSHQDPVRILGSGMQRRHYTWGGDLANGIVAAMEHPDAPGEDFNLSSAQGTTVLELARMIIAKVRGPDAPARFVSGKPYEHDVPCRIPDVSKARRMLGFTAATSLSEMLDEVIPWVAGAMKDGRM